MQQEQREKKSTIKERERCIYERDLENRVAGEYSDHNNRKIHLTHQFRDRTKKSTKNTEIGIFWIWDDGLSVLFPLQDHRDLSFVIVLALLLLERDRELRRR